MKVKILAIGGGIASFGLVDVLRSSGVLARDIRIVSTHSSPYSQFVERCQNSGITMEDRLRSDSAATPGNVWGWPTFGMRESYSHLMSGHPLQAVKRATQLFVEPIFADTYTPKLSHVTNAIDKECERIDYQEMLVQGVVTEIVNTGDCWTATVEMSDGTTTQISADHVHIATGYQGNKQTADHQYLIAQLGDSYAHIYEPHEHIYEKALNEGGNVILRGRGIAASRALEKLLNIAKVQPKLKIIHVMNNELTGDEAPVEHNKHVQPFNFPKDAFGGHRLKEFNNMNLADRKLFIQSLGKTTTAKRKHWTDQIEQALERGQYEIKIGAIAANPHGVFIDHAIESSGENFKIIGLIDSIGLTRDLSQSPPIYSLLRDGHIQFKEAGLLEMNEAFEAQTNQHQTTNIFFGGTTALGGPFPPVDSFSGANFNGHVVGHEIIRRMNSSQSERRPLISQSPVSSFGAWLKWARGVAP